jgi:general stress protein 26
MAVDVKRLSIVQEHLFKLIKDIQFAMLTTTDDDGSLRSRPMAYKQGESDSHNELWFVKIVFFSRYVCDEHERHVILLKVFHAN